MSQFSLPIRSAPGITPIHTKGNAFWKGKERFLIKGTSYSIPTSNPQDSEPEPKPDSLGGDRLEQLRRDIKIFHELGLNTVRVYGLKPSTDHKQALHLLAQAGIYVLVEIGERIKRPAAAVAQNPNFDAQAYYTSYALRRALAVVDEVADCPNVLGFMVCGNAASQNTSRMAEVCRALIRDTKAFLQLRGGRTPPVGFRANDLMIIRWNTVQYFTAGTKDERADFFSLNCFSWANRSSFQISGWKSMVELFEQYPAPMFLAEYGTNLGMTRIWQEVECLYSRDMTGVFSGGCVYTYCDNSNYGIVSTAEDGTIEKKEDFAALKEQFDLVNSRTSEELFNAETKDYESFIGAFPAGNQHFWNATAVLPQAPFELETLLQPPFPDKKEG